MEIALITGANRGIGFETAKQLLQSGYQVIITSRDTKKGEEALASLQQFSTHTECLRMEATSETDQDNVVRHISEKYGRLDVLVNNAGAYYELGGDWLGNTATSVSQDILKKTFEVNFFSVVGLTQKLLPLIEKSANGRIVNVSSIMASMNIHSNPDGGLAEVKPLAYDASKSAVNAFTTHLAEALRSKKIPVNSVHPGWVATDMGTNRAPMSVSDGAKTLVDMAMDKSGITGRYIHLGEELPW